MTAPGPDVPPRPADSELDRLDALALAGLIRRRALSPRELLEHVIGRIESLDPHINAVPLRHLAEARAAVDRGVDPDAPFAGVPFLLKDLWCDLAGTETTHGSRLFAGQRATRDSEIVRRFRRAGLVIVGKTASPEFGLSPSSESTLHGATHNPWNADRVAGGSSGGAAAAVAARMVPMAHATDGGGSIRIPASCCGIFGLKPTRARTPHGPRKFEGWGGLSCGHAVSVSVRDNAALLDAVAGAELGAPYSAPPHGSFLAAVARRPPRLRIALMRTPYSGTPVDRECLDAVDAAARLCQSLGHVVEEAWPRLDGTALVNAFGATVTVAIRQTLEDRAAELGRAWTAADVEPMTAMIAGFGGEVTGVTHARARETLIAAGRTVAEFLVSWDLILSPTLAQPPVPLGTVASTVGDFQAYGRDTTRFSPFTATANITGQPAMSVPLHWSQDGLPIGVMFSGRFGEEELLYSLAGQLEEAAPWHDRVPPLGGC